MSIIFVADIHLITVECCNCHVTFAMPKEWNDHFRKTHQNFYCPAGHGQSYGGESEIEKAKREARAIELRLQSSLNEERHARTVAEKARKKAELQKKRLEKRIAAGVCPCCNRTFGNLADHMKTQHKGELGSGKEPKMIAGCVMAPDWQPISTAPDRETVLTKIDDEKGSRNEQQLKRQGRLWFFPDGGMYAYYEPTHWAPL